MDLVEAFRATDAAVAVVGAGGKKTTMYALAKRLDRAVVTATVRIPIFDPHVDHVSVTTDPVARLRAATVTDFPLGLVPARERDDRYLGYGADVVDAIVEEHDGPVLIKADGARMREFKAPAAAEPQIPSLADVVVPVASVRVVGEPLTDAVVHRPERVAAVASAAGLDVAVGDDVTPEVVAAVLASEDGGLKDVPESAVAVPLVNKVDDANDERIAREIASSIRDRIRAVDDAPSVPHVVLGRLIDGAVVDVV